MQVGNSLEDSRILEKIFWRRLLERSRRRPVLRARDNRSSCSGKRFPDSVDSNEFRQTSKTRFPLVGDIYFVATMRLIDETKKEIICCPHETEEARWFSREEINELDEQQLHQFIRQILERFNKFKANGRKVRIRGNQM